jgi:hypothetical protein
MRYLTERVALASCIVALVGSHAGSISLRSARVEPVDPEGTTRVIIEANGALPELSSGTAANPARIYLDFPDVTPLRTVEPVSPNPVVARIRIAEHSAIPLVTRVVIDLIKEAHYRIDVSGRTQGRVVVIIGAPPAPQPRAANPVTVAQKPTSSAMPEARSQPPAARQPSEESQYAVRVSTALVRLHALKPLLEAIDRRADSVPGDLNAASNEFDDVAKLLTAIKPPPARTSTHALLIRTCTLGSRAARLRQSNGASQDAASGWEAASAAAGALLMLERANGDLIKGKR